MSAESLDALDAEFRRFKAWCELDETKLAVELVRSARERTLDLALEETPSEGNTIMQLIGEARGLKLFADYMKDREISLRAAMAEAQRNQEMQVKPGGS